MPKSSVSSLLHVSERIAPDINLMSLDFAVYRRLNFVINIMITAQWNLQKFGKTSVKDVRNGILVEYVD